MISARSTSYSAPVGGFAPRLAMQTVHGARTRCAALRARARQRGATLLSVMLLMISLMTLGLLAVRSASREVTQAGQLVAHERAQMAAQAALELATARYADLPPDLLDSALAGTLPQAGPCTNPCRDCIPDSTTVTGQRNPILAGAEVSCGGRPCMRQGAVSMLSDASGSETHWCDVPLRDLLPTADPEARVSTWVRNDTGDALGGGAGSGSWTDDADGRLVLTSMAKVRGVTVTLEQEVLLWRATGPQALRPQSPDDGYGGGHNNDNSTVSVCVSDYVAAAAAS
jgi:Tfp pilus assembly protein PilX